jgi:hypothetical protein
MVSGHTFVSVPVPASARDENTDTKVLGDTIVQLFASHSSVVIVLRRRFAQTFKHLGAGSRPGCNPPSESRTAMHDMQLSPVSERPRASGPMNDTPVNIAEYELLTFINSVTDLFGPDQNKFLTEIWLDALASMDCMPGPASPDWPLVTLAASVRLAAQLLEIPDRYALF